MDLSEIPSVGPVYRSVLEEAGIRTVAALAAESDLETLARRTKLNPGLLETFRHDARARMERAFADAGVASPADLVDADAAALAHATGSDVQHITYFQRTARQAVQAALHDAGYRDRASLAAMEDLEALSQRTGIPVPRLVQYRDAARRDLAPPVEEVAVSPAPLPPTPPPMLAVTEGRVVLHDGLGTARVELGSARHDPVPIVVARADQEETSVLARVDGPAVLLKERSPTAFVRVAGVHAALPVFREFSVVEGGPIQTMRVRVAEIRERPESKGFLGRFARRK